VPELGRREEWPETVDRYLGFFKGKFPGTKAVPWKELREAILALDVMPSMRCLMTAGEALDKDNVSGYNCAYVAVDNPKVFDEIMYILMCGTGVGYSVERQFINKLPEVAETMHTNETIIVVADSKVGWAGAFRQLIALLYQGQIPKWDLSKVRPKGAPLKTFGGRASGPEPLDDLFNFTIRLFRKATGRRLNSLEVHDLVCKIASVVVCGGVRRSALLSLSNLTDDRMRHAKSGNWWEADPQRALANNSVAYTEKPDMGSFMREWHSLFESKSGERGIFSRYAIKDAIPARRDPEHEFGTNPCSEIILRSRQFCNLSEVVVRPGDTASKLKRKVELATILGTLQATLTDFRYISSEWRKNTEEERLLGVSLTGVMDHPHLSEVSARAAGLLSSLKDAAIQTNLRYAKILGIPQATAITCVKPSGTVSQLVNSASGLHPRYSEYYLRRVRGDALDPVGQALEAAGIPAEPDNLRPQERVYSFPIMSPSQSRHISDMRAVDQLNHWEQMQMYWCEHKPSISVYVREDEWLKVAAWVYENFDSMTGVSFFPYEDSVYKQAPYEVITKEKYEALVAKFPRTIDLNVPESVDQTVSSQELACIAGACDVR
jgi:ribonucleoside-diphosphate reductase alpha chain